MPAFDREAFLTQFWRQEAALIARGFPPLSPWWRTEIERFVRSGCRRWTIRAGRRAGKSTSIARLLVAWAWLGDGWEVPPGDIATIPIISISKDESASKLRTIGALLRALDLPHEQRAEDIELLGARPVLFRTLAATTTAVVGGTAIAVFGDEVARWESREDMRNPAHEVIGSVMPQLATQPLGFAVWCSSPWSQDDEHAVMYDQGDTEQQVTSFAESWVANPVLTEAATHELEPDLRVWAREYAAVPGDNVSAALDLVDLRACFDRFVVRVRSPFVAIDASSLRGDAFTYIAGGVSEAGELAVCEAGGFEDEQLRGLSMATVVEHIAGRCRAWRTSTVFADQREEASLRAMFAERDIHFISYAWSEPSKDTAMQTLRRLMRDRAVILPEHTRLRRELTNMKARLQPSGRISYVTNGLDYASAVITLAHALDAFQISLDPPPEKPDYSIRGLLGGRLSASPWRDRRW